MHPPFETSLQQLRSNDKDLQDQAYSSLMGMTSQPVTWAYAIWDELVTTLRDKDNRRRSIAAQVLCNLAKNDPEQRMAVTLPHLLAVTRDERFVTARHCMQSLWKVGIAGEALRTQLAAGLAGRFQECIAEKNCTLIRFDIIEVMARIFDETKDETLRQQAQAWIATEQDQKYRKKYAAVWKKR